MEMYKSDLSQQQSIVKPVTFLLKSFADAELLTERSDLYFFQFGVSLNCGRLLVGAPENY
jgi:hypothetical protein